MNWNINQDQLLDRIEYLEENGRFMQNALEMAIYEIAKKMENEARNSRLDGIAGSASALKSRMEEIAGYTTV